MTMTDSFGELAYCAVCGERPADQILVFRFYPDCEYESYCPLHLADLVRTWFGDNTGAYWAFVRYSLRIDEGRRIGP